MSAFVIILFTKIQQVSPLSVLLSSLHVAESLDLIQPRGGSKIEHLCVSRCQQLPGVAPGVAVPGVSANQDPWLPGGVVLLVDRVFVAEGPVPRGYGGGGLAGGGRVEILSERDDGVNHGPVLLPPVALVDVFPVEMTLGTLNNLIGYTSVAACAAGLALNRILTQNVTSKSFSPIASANSAAV